MTTNDPQSRYETMRTDPSNWKMGTLYCCREDPRIVVRNLLPFGWTWNFGHKKVYFAILLAVAALLAPPLLAWQLGLRSSLAMGIIIAIAFFLVIIVASRLARDPET